MRIVWDTTECTRCDGTGQHSYNPMHGRRCFKCKGTGRQISRKGAAARKAWTQEITDVCSRPLWSLRVGDVIWWRKRNGDEGWVTIASFAEIDGDHVVMHCDGMLFDGRWDARFVKWDADDRQDIREEIVRRFSGARIEE
ncbi:hypothetical protein [Streptomyces sp. NPDC007063]|uniref:hypothetical protein n=1 Tax=Streptomyces sp. NPDC007063 TaxID=3364772 RepID=UPI0036BEF9CB